MNKVKTFSLIGLCVGLFGLISIIIPYIIAYFFSANETESIGIIGGADGPTAMFITFEIFIKKQILPIILSLALIIISTIYLIFNKTATSHCGIQTSVLSASMSFSIALGMWSFFQLYIMAVFHEFSSNPIRHRVSIALGIIALIAVILLLVFYCKARKTRPSIGGIILDIATALLLILPFIYIIDFINGLYVRII